MKLKFLNLIVGFCTLLMINGCSDKDTPEDVPGDYTLKVKVDCKADAGNDSPLQILIADPGNVSNPVEVEPGEGFSDELEMEISALPCSGGFVVFPSIVDDGEKCLFDVKGEVALLKGGKVISSKVIDDTVTVTDLENDHTFAYLYEASEDGLEKAGVITEEELDSSNNKQETFEEYKIGDDKNEISKIVTPIEYSFSVEDKVLADEYWDPNKKPKEKDAKGNEYDSNKYTVLNKIYNLYDTVNKRNYYLIEQFVTTECSPCYAGIYNKTIKTGSKNAKCNTIAKICEWHGDYVQIGMAPTNFGDMKSEVNAIPETAEKTISKTCGFSWNLGGKVSYSEKGPAGEVAGGITASRTFSYCLPDVTILNDCRPDEFFKWKFKMREPKTGFNPVYTAASDIAEVAEVSRHTMRKQTAFGFSTKASKPQICVELEVGLKATTLKCGVEHGSKYRTTARRGFINLPYWEYDANGKLVQRVDTSMVLEKLTVRRSFDF